MNDERPPLHHGKRGEYLVLLQFVLFFTFVLMPAWNPLIAPALVADTTSLRWAALLFFGGIGLLLGGLGVVHIREYLTPLPYPVDHSRLVEHGVYSIVRHPLYSSQLFAGFGWTTFTLSLSHACLLLLGFLFFNHKATKEEQWLQERHPDYIDYKRRVKKFIPWMY